MIDVSALLRKPKNGRELGVRAVAALAVLMAIQAMAMPIAFAVYAAIPPLEKALRGTVVSSLILHAWLLIYIIVNFAFRRLTTTDRSLWVWIVDCGRDFEDYLKSRRTKHRRDEEPKREGPYRRAPSNPGIHARPDPPSSSMTSICVTHGLRYDPATSSGCVLCRRSLQPPPRRGAARVAIVGAIVVALASTCLLRSRNVDTSAPAGAANGTPAQGGDNDLLRPRATDAHQGALHVANSDGRTGAFYVPGHEGGRSLPLLVALHGTGGDGSAMVQAFRALADQYTFVIIAPDSRKAPNGQWSWEVGERRGDVTADYKHVIDCVDEVRSLRVFTVDSAHVLIAGHSGGASSAPYIASNEEMFTAFAVLHGGVIPGGIGTHHVRGWFSTGDKDTVRPAALVQRSVDYLVKNERFSDVQFHVYDGFHDMTREELEAVIAWWLRG